MDEQLPYFGHGVFGRNYTKHLFRFLSSHYPIFRANYKNPCTLLLEFTSVKHNLINLVIFFI